LERLLIDYLPNFLKEAYEYKEIMATEQPEFILAWKKATQAKDDQFLQTLTLSGIERWEKMMKIQHKYTDSIEDRRFRIYLRMLEKPPYTYEYLVEKLKNICGKGGYYINLDTDNFYLEIRLSLHRKNNIEDVRELLDRILPANIKLFLDYMYNKHEQLTVYTHRKLGKSTHEQLREEVLT